MSSTRLRSRLAAGRLPADGCQWSQRLVRSSEEKQSQDPDFKSKFEQLRLGLGRACFRDLILGWLSGESSLLRARVDSPLVS